MSLFSPCVWSGQPNGALTRASRHPTAQTLHLKVPCCPGGWTPAGLALVGSQWPRCKDTWLGEQGAASNRTRTPSTLGAAAFPVPPAGEGEGRDAPRAPGGLRCRLHAARMAGRGRDPLPCNPSPHWLLLLLTHLRTCFPQVQGSGRLGGAVRCWGAGRAAPRLPLSVHLPQESASVCSALGRACWQALREGPTFPLPWSRPLTTLAGQRNFSGAPPMVPFGPASLPSPTGLQTQCAAPSRGAPHPPPCIVGLAVPGQAALLRKCH